MNRMLSCFLSVVFAAVLSRADQPVMPSVQFSLTDRILILSPHPDDEVIATGGIIQQALAQDLPIHVAFFTYGDNNEWAFAFCCTGCCSLSAIALAKAESSKVSEQVVGCGFQTWLMFSVVPVQSRERRAVG
jgi:hypothetical protein